MSWRFPPGFRGTGTTTILRRPEAARTDPVRRETCNDTELFFSLNWHLYSFQARDMDISVTGNAYPSLSDWGRARGDCCST